MPEEKLRHFIRGFLENLLGVDRPVLLLQLVAREMMEPTPALDLVVDEGARPVRDVLSVIVAELMGRGADPVLIRDSAASVLSQCASYQNSQAVVQRLSHMDVHNPATIEHLAEHVYRFSLGGIRAMVGGGKVGKSRKGSGKGTVPFSSDHASHGARKSGQSTLRQEAAKI